MSKPESSKTESSDDVELGQLFNLIGRGFQKVFHAFLSVYGYFKRNFLWFSGLAVLGVFTGYLINQLVEDKQKLEVIVSPSSDGTNYMFDTRRYLYDIVDEIQSEIKVGDTSFFQSLGLDVAKMNGFEISVAPLKLKDQELLQDEDGILEALKEFGNSEAIAETLESEFRKRTTKDQRITFLFRGTTPGKEYAEKIMAYINSNLYYRQLVQIQEDNARKRIRTNDSLMGQIDRLIKNYTEKLARDQSAAQGKLILENQDPLNVPALFQLKNELVMDTELKKLEMVMSRDPINIVNFGNPHKMERPLLRKNIVFFPLLFMGAFLLIALVGYLNRKAEKLV